MLPRSCDLSEGSEGCVRLSSICKTAFGSAVTAISILGKGVELRRAILVGVFRTTEPPVKQVAGMLGDLRSSHRNL